MFIGYTVTSLGPLFVALGLIFCPDLISCLLSRYVKSVTLLYQISPCPCLKRFRNEKFRAYGL